MKLADVQLDDLILLEDLVGGTSIADANEGAHSNIVDCSNYEQLGFRGIVTSVSGTTPSLDFNLQTSPAPQEQYNQNQSTGADTWTVLRNNTNDNIMLDFWFTTGTLPISVNEVSLLLKSAGTIAAAKYIQVQIDADSSDDPATADGTLDKAGVLGYSDQILANSIGTTGEIVTFTFATPVNLAASTKYHFVLVGDYTVSTSNHILLGSITGTSNMRIFDSAWAALASNIAYAQVNGYEWTDAPAACQPAAMTAAGTTETNFSRRAFVTGNYVRGYSTVTGTSTPTLNGHFLLLGSGKRVIT